MTGLSGVGFGSSGVTGLSGVGFGSSGVTGLSGVGFGSSGVTGFSGSGSASVSAPESPLSRHVAVADTSCSLITATLVNFLESPTWVMETRHVQLPSPSAGATDVISRLSADNLFAEAFVVSAQFAVFVQ